MFGLFSPLSNPHKQPADLAEKPKHRKTPPKTAVDKKKLKVIILATALHLHISVIKCNFNMNYTITYHFKQENDKTQDKMAKIKQNRLAKKSKSAPICNTMPEEIINQVREQRMNNTYIGRSKRQKRVSFEKYKV